MDTENTAVTPEQETAPAEKKAKKEKKVSAQQEKIAALEQQLAESQDMYQRMLAEYANYKRRTEQEKLDLGAFTTAQIVAGLLTTLDNMERAMDAPEGENYKAGVEMVVRQFKESLEKLGLEEIQADGAPFDPSLHNAVMREDADGVDTDTVTEVFQKGYTIGERVLRPAMVKVAH